MARQKHHVHFAATGKPRNRSPKPFKAPTPERPKRIIKFKNTLLQDLELQSKNKPVPRRSTRVPKMAAVNAVNDDGDVTMTGAVNAVTAPIQDVQKLNNSHTVNAASPTDTPSPATTTTSTSSTESARKKRGRPKKVPADATTAQTSNANASAAGVEKLAVDNASPTTTDSPLSEIESPEEQEILQPLPVANLSANRAWGREGKQPMRDGQTPHEAIAISTDEPEIIEEDVDEGDIDYDDHHPSEHELDPEDDVPPEVVDLADDDTDDEDVPPDVLADRQRKAEAKNPDALLERPWRAPGFDVNMRQQLESMYCQLEGRAIHGSWRNTENYQLEKDKEMLRYIADHPLGTWTLPKQQVDQAYFSVLDRTRLRSMGLAIYEAMFPRHLPGNPNMHPAGMGNQWHPGQGQHHQQPNGPHRQASLGGFGDQRRQSGPPPQHQGQPFAPPPGHVLPSQPQGVPSGPHGMPNGMSPNGPHPSHYPHPQHMMGPMGPPPHPQPQQQGLPNGMPYGGQGPQMIHPSMQPMQMMPQQQQQQQHMPMIHPSMQSMQQSAHGHGQTVGGAPRSGGRKKKSPPPPEPMSPGPAPPYDERPRPAERKTTVSKGRKNARKQAEAEEFPWHRRHIDFEREKAIADWDTSCYDPNILDSMREVRRLNGPKIQKIDEKLAEQQKNARNRKKAEALARGMGGDAGEGDYNEGRPKIGRPRGSKKNADNVGGDPYYSGILVFITDADYQRARALGGFRDPDGILAAWRAGEVNIEDPALKNILVCWNPGKQGITQTLDQAVFRMYDTLITRQQLAACPILTKRAAECVVDFCPDLLWREMLLRIVSEAGYGNKDVRNRICYNGCYCDKATVTKRIAAALGQKQINAPRKKAEQKTKLEEARETAANGGKVTRRGPEPNLDAHRYLAGEKEWNDGNKTDFEKYIRYFGKRPGTYVRKSKRSVSGGFSMKRDADEMLEGEAGPSGGAGSVKRARTEESVASPMTASDSAESEMTSPEAHEEESDESEEEHEEEDDEDAVSEQSDGILDEIED